MLTNETIAVLAERKAKGESVKALAAEAGVAWQKLVAAFKKVNAAQPEGSEEGQAVAVLDAPAFIHDGEVSEADLARWEDEGGPALDGGPGEPDAPAAPTAATGTATAAPKAKKARKKGASAADRLAEKLGVDLIAEYGHRWTAGAKLAELVREAQVVCPEHGHTLYYVLRKAGFAGK